MSYSIKNLTTKSSSLFKKIEVLFLGYILAKFVEDMNKVDCIDLNGADAKCGSTNGINESFEFRGVGKKPTAVAQCSNIAAYEEVGIIPLTVVVRTPSCKLLIYKLAIFIKEAIS